VASECRASTAGPLAHRDARHAGTVLGRGGVGFAVKSHAVTETLARAAEQLADAMQADACAEYEAERQAQGLTGSPPLVIASDVDPVGAVRS
jgi:hypothetical protein